MQECDNCGSCCKNPGIMVPEDISNISNYLKISEKEFMKKYGILTIIQDNNSLLFAALPVKSEKPDVRMSNKIVSLSYNLRKSECIFRKDNKCSIHQVKPAGCRIYKCSKMTGKEEEKLNVSSIKDSWKSFQGRLKEFSPELQILTNLSLNEISEIFKEKQNEVSIRLL